MGDRYIFGGRYRGRRELGSEWIKRCWFAVVPKDANPYVDVDS